MIHVAQDEPPQASGQFGVVVRQVLHWQYREYSPAEGWHPAVNVYLMEDRIEVCADLAGVDPASIEVRVEGNDLLIRGYRPAPEPRRRPQAMRILTMEVDHGPFCRAVRLDHPIDPRGVRSEYGAGLLWVRLPRA